MRLWGAVCLLWIVAAHPPAFAEDAEIACAAMRDAYATIDDATRCALARGWKTSRFWVQTSAWQQGDRNSSSYVRIMCAAPSYIEEGGRRRALWNIVTVRAQQSDSEAFVIDTPSGTQGFRHLEDAANAACGNLHLPAAARRRD